MYMLRGQGVLSRPFILLDEEKENTLREVFS